MTTLKVCALALLILVVGCSTKDPIQPVKLGSIELSDTNLVATSNAGRTPASQQIEITNSGDGTMNWKATCLSDWLAVSPASGTNDGVISLSFNIVGLRTGTYYDTVTVSCENATNSPQTVEVMLNVSAIIMPLTVGNLWTYNLLAFNPPSPTPFDTADYSMEIVGRTIIENEQWYQARHIFSNDGSADTAFWYYTVSTYGLFVRAGEATPVLHKLYYPANVGQTFEGFNEFLFQYFAIDVVPAGILALNNPITVPLGNFSCYQSVLDLDGVYQYEYYHLNIGMVKTELMVPDGPEFYPFLIFELRDVELH